MHATSATSDTSVAAVGHEPADEIVFQLLPLIRVYKSGRVERLCGTSTIPASFDPATKVRSKDVVIDTKAEITARLYLPTTTTTTTSTDNDNLPILVYFHGGAFLIESAFSPTYHPHLNDLTSFGQVLAVSVNYRLAPENPLPIAYQDSWAALQWVFSRSDPWISERGDLNRLYVAGDSAGANIAQQMAVRAGAEGVKMIKGMALVHAYFWGEEPVGTEDREAGFRADMEQMWRFLCPVTEGLDDPRINPVAKTAAGLSGLGCERVLIAVAGKDVLWSRGKLYYERLMRSGWRGEIELVEAAGAEHDYHIFNPQTEEAIALTKKLAAFFV